MPKQSGHIKIRGTIDDLTYAKTKDGFSVRKATIVPKGRMFKDPRFKRTRENLQEFNEAAKSNKLIRHCFSGVSKNIADKRVMTRLTAALFPVIRTDSQNPRGYRKVTYGDLSKLKGFEFNAVNPMTSAFRDPVVTTINRPNGEVSIAMPAYTPGITIKYPNEATHYRFVYAAAALDFLTENFSRDVKLGATQLLDELPVAAATTVLQLPANSSDPVFVLLGIEFFQKSEDGLLSLLTNGSFSSLQLILVDQQ